MNSLVVPRWLDRTITVLVCSYAFLAIGVPVVILIAAAANERGAAVSRVFSNRLYHRVIIDTAVTSAAAAIVATVVGTSVAIVSAVRQDWIERLALDVATTSMALGTVVRTFGWYVLLSDSGIPSSVARVISGSAIHLLFNRGAVIIVMGSILAPWALLTCWSFMRPWIRQSWVVSSSLGASDILFATCVIAPRSVRMVISTWCLLVLLACGFYVTPALIGGGNSGTVTASMLIDQQLSAMGDIPTAASLAILLFLTVLTFAATAAALLLPRGGSLR
jgi:putative spermidine/putrescine transport system permease protein